MTYRLDVLKLTHDDFASEVEDLLKLYGWRWMHSRPARTNYGWVTALSGHKGFPDYVAVRGSRLLFFEIKSDKGKLTYEQQAWIDELRNTGKCEAYIWRPRDFNVMLGILRGDGGDMKGGVKCTGRNL